MNARLLDDVASDYTFRRSVGVEARRVVIVEDDRIAVELLTLVLAQAGHVVQVYPDGESAVASTSASKPAAAIIDIGLPGISGYAVAQEMRKQWGTSVLLIALTAHDTPEEIAKARYAGFNWHFSKPALPSRVAEVLRNPGRAPSAKRDGLLLCAVSHAL